MLKAVCALRDEVLRRAGDGEITLELIDKVVRDCTALDEITYVQFDAGPRNPIWGEFQRWTKSPSVYASAQTLVEIRYASLLSPDWRKFVVTKELCHAIDAPEGTHDITSMAIDNVVLSFSLLSNAEALQGFGPAFAMELMAEVGALEILCPVDRRRKILSEDATPDIMKLREKFNLPVKYINRAFNPNYMLAIENLINNS